MPITEQGLYTDGPRAAGEVATHTPDQIIETLAAENAIKFGRGVMAGTDIGAQGKNFATSLRTFEGLAVVSMEATDLDTAAYAAGDALGVAKKGRFWAYVEEAVDPEDPVRIRHTANTGKYAGDFATSADAGKTNLLTGVRFRSTTTGAGLVELELTGTFSLAADS